MRKLFAYSLLLILLVYQGCTGGMQNPLQFQSPPRPVLTTAFAGGGNGDGYDGKLRILHHYVDNFTCEGRLIPESILVRDAKLDWYLFQNSQQTCLADEAFAVQGVNYDEAANNATYEGKLYVPPRPYFVDAKADPNLPDTNLADGVCADETGSCSLQAAIQQTIPVSFTEAVLVHIPAGTFNLTSALSLMGVTPDSHAITVRGESPATSILNGGGVSRHFSVRSTSMAPISIENLTLQNGFHGDGPTAGASISYQLDQFISLYGKTTEDHLKQIRTYFPEYDEVNANPLKAQLNVINCVFRDNKNTDTIKAWPLTGNLTIRKSSFIGNAAHGVYSLSANSLTIEDSSFSKQDARGVVVDDNISNISIKRSTFSETYSGVSFRNCRNCSVESVEIFHNRNVGLEIMATDVNPLYDVTVRDARIYDNLLGNLDIQFFGTTPNFLNLIDSNLLMVNAAVPNCSSATSVNQIRMTNTTVSDLTCQP